MAYGFNGHIGYAKETSWGSAVAATDYFHALSEDMDYNLTRFDTKNIVATVAEQDDDVGIGRVAGSITAGMNPVPLGTFLKASLQTASGSVVTSGFLWRTDFSTATSDFSTDCPVQPYTLEIYRDVTSSMRLGGIVMTQLDLSIRPEQVSTMRGSFIGRNLALIAKTTPTFPGSPLQPFNFSTCSISIGGSGTARVEEFNMSINSNLEDVAALNNSSSVAKIRRRGPQTISISGVLDFADVTEYLDFINQTERRWTLSMTAAASHQFILDMPRVLYTAFPTPNPGRGRITANFAGKVYYSTGSATAIKASVITVKSNY